MMSEIDDIFTAVMNAAQPPVVKRALAKKYIAAAAENQSLEKSLRMMECTMQLIVNGRDKTVEELSWSVFDAWSAKDDHFEGFFTAEKISSLLQNVYQNPSNVIALLGKGLERMRCCNCFNDLCLTASRNAAGFVEQNPRYDVLLRFCVFICAFPDVLPRNERLSCFCMSMIKSISKFTPPANPSDVVHYTGVVPVVFGDLLVKCWKIGGYQLCHVCLETVFELISAPINVDRRLSLALGAVLQVFPSDLMKASIREITSDTLVSDNTLFNTLRHMINWLAWPNIKYIGVWTNYFLDCLDVVERHDLLNKITVESVLKLTARLESPHMRRSNFEVLEFMLQGCQHSEIPFSMILPKVGAIYSAIVNESTEESKDFLRRFSDLLRCLVRLHSGHADLCAPIQPLIEKETLSDDVFETFKESAWMKKKSNQKICKAVEVQKVFDGKTGLQNDHNTCFLNSVIQAFYMCDSLTEQLLTTEFPKEAEMLVSVQLLFAYLRFSKRSSIDCEWFEKVATPSSFVRGNQEDASELFNHLVDSLMEQEKLLPTRHLVFESFYGLQKSTHRCLSCGNEVSRTCLFAELSLHFKNENVPKSTAACMGGGNKQYSSNASSSDKSNDEECLLLEDLLSHYFETEQLEDDCKYSCENCETDQNGEKLVSLLETPEFLRITLNRFTYKDFVSCKIMTEVKIPRTLMLPVQRESDQKVTDVFCLFAVVVHCGRNTNSGHYYCIARRPELIEEKTVTQLDILTIRSNSDFFVDRWFKFDDETVSKSSFDDLSGRFGRTPYILLYRKITGDIVSYYETGLNDIEARVPHHVLKLVENDNRKYLKEIEARQRLFSAGSTNTSKSNWRKDDEDDDDDYPQSSDKFNEMPRMVF